MSMLHMVQAMKIKVGNPNRKLVLIKLADNASDTGKCWPSYQHIADHTEMSVSSVKRHIKKLAEDGLLSIVNRKCEERGNKSNMYFLTLNNPPPSVHSEPTPSVTVNPPSVHSEPTPSVTVNTRTSQLEPVIEPVNKTSLSENKFSDDDMTLAKFMFGRIKQVLTKAKEPSFNKWADTIRLMRERDNLTHKEIQEVFLWANGDEFWKVNIASPSKLRDKFDTLHAKANIQPKDIDEVAHRPAVPLRVPEPTRQLSDKERAETLAKIAKIKEGIDND